MKLLSYDRPREKIIATSVGALSDHELLQAILGSGVKGASVTVIARRILKLMRSQKKLPTYEALRAIEGVGPAKASSLTACLELARRWSRKNRDKNSPQPHVETGSIHCEFLSASNERIDDRWYVSQMTPHYWVKQVVTEAIKVHAATIIVHDATVHAGSLAKLDVLERRQRLIIACDALSIGLVKYEWVKQSGEVEVL
jgi:DNA repair protein RadC